MKYYKMFSGLLALFIITVATAAAAEPPELPDVKEVAPRYQIVNLGESDIDPSTLTRQASVPSLAPMINNDGQVIGNRLGGGFLRDPLSGEWAPFIHDVVINFHALTHQGDILVSINRKSNPTEWMIWPTATGKNGPRQRIDSDAYAGNKLVLIGLTNDRMAVGNLFEGDAVKPFYWKSGGELSFFEADDGNPIYGTIQSMNNQSQIAAYFKKDKETPPGVWNEKVGLQTIRNFRAKPVPGGEAELYDLLIADDGTVYGTYRIKYIDMNKQSDFIAYAWVPYEGGGFKLLDLDGMRLRGLNDWHTLVGSLRGQAAICEPGNRPQEISKLLPQMDLKDWQLIEATSINNRGDIVGYGKFRGNMHLFLVQKKA